MLKQAILMGRRLNACAHDQSSCRDMCVSKAELGGVGGELGHLTGAQDTHSMREAQQGWQILREMSYLCGCGEQERGGRAEM